MEAYRDPPPVEEKQEDEALPEAPANQLDNINIQNQFKNML